MVDLSNLFTKIEPTPEDYKPGDKIEYPKAEPEHKVVELEESNEADTKNQIEVVLGHMAKIEKDYFGVSNIPVNHDYYEVLRPRLHALQEILSRK